MNMIVSRTAIENAAATANINHTMADIFAMLEGKLKPTKPVIELLKKLKDGEVIEPPKDVRPIELRGGRPKADIYKNRRDAQLTRRPFTDFIDPILTMLKDTDKPCVEIAAELNQPRSMIQHVLNKMGKQDLLDSQLTYGGERRWFIKGYSTPRLQAFKLAKEIRHQAKISHSQHYDALSCDKCGTTKRVTLSDKCVECSRRFSYRNFLNRKAAQQTEIQK